MSWPVAHLGDVTTKIGSGSTPRGGSDAYKSSGVPLVRSMNVYDGEFVEAGLVHLDDQQAKLLKHVALNSGDVLLNITGASVGRVCRLPERFVGARVNQHVSIIRPDRGKLDPHFLEHLLRAPTAKSALLRIAGSGATREAITKSQIEEFSIPLPPLAEQRRIAAILDKADTLRRKRERTLELLNGLTRSMFTEMFGFKSDQIYSPASLKEICKKITDGTHQSPKWSLSGVPFLFVSNIRNQEISFETNKYISDDEYRSLTKRTPIDAGDVLYTTVGSYGHAAVVPPHKRFIFQRHIAHIKPKPTILNSIFLAIALEMPAAKAQADRFAQGVAQKTVTLSNLRELTIPLAPIAAQIDFATKVDAIAKSKKRAESCILRYDLLFSSLQHRAFTGQL